MSYREIYNRSRHRTWIGDGFLFYAGWFMRFSLMRDIEQELKEGNELCGFEKEEHSRY